MESMPRILLALLACIVFSGAAPAQIYPARPIRLVVAFAPGGPADIIARLVAQKLGEGLGQTVIVENRGGAGGNLAAGFVAKAAADGHTMLVTTTAFAINPGLSPNAGYDPLKDFSGVIVAASAPHILGTYPGLGVSTLQEFIVAARTGRFSYASAGTGTGPHLTAEYLLRTLSGLDITHVPFSGGGPAAGAVAGGQVELLTTVLPAALALARGGKIKLLAVTSRSRVPGLPDVPTVGESGFPGYEDSTWVAMLAPSATSPEIVNRLNGDTNRILQGAAMKERLSGLGFESTPNSTQQFSDYLKTEVAKWGRIVRESGIKAN